MLLRILSVIWTGLLLMAPFIKAQNQENGFKPPQPHRQMGRWNRDLVRMESRDALNFNSPKVVIERAGVPSLARNSKDRLVMVFQWFPFDNQKAFDRMAVSFSDDEGVTWAKPELLEIVGYPEEYIRPFDPTVVSLPDGRLRLYFTVNQEGPDGKPCICSAISNDDLLFTARQDSKKIESDGAFTQLSALRFQNTIPRTLEAASR